MKNSSWALGVTLLLYVMGPRGMLWVESQGNTTTVMDLTTGHNTMMIRQNDGLYILPDTGKGEALDFQTNTIVPFAIEAPTAPEGLPSFDN